MEDFFAIKCRNCGGPMYSHQATRSFECAYCGTSEPWGEGAAGARFHREVPPSTPSNGKRPDQATPSIAPRAPEGIRLVLLQALLAQHVPRRVDFKRGPRHRRRVRARYDREHPLSVLRRGVRGRVDPERVRMPVVRKQNRRHRPAATRHLQQAPVHRDGLGIHP